MATSGAPTSLPHDSARDMNSLSGTPIIDQAWQRLISNSVPQDELASLVETVFSKKNINDLVDRLQGIYVQAFIDVVHTVRHCTLQHSEDGLADSVNSLHLLGIGYP